MCVRKIGADLCDDTYGILSDYGNNCLVNCVFHFFILSFSHLLLSLIRCYTLTNSETSSRFATEIEKSDPS